MERWFTSLLLLCLFFIVGVASLKCFTCNFPDEKCGDAIGYTNLEAHDCPTSCVSRRGVREDGRVENYRGCYRRHEGTYCTRSDYVGMRVMLCFCNSSYCNHSNSVRVSFVGLAAVFITVLYNLLYI